MQLHGPASTLSKHSSNSSVYNVLRFFSNCKPKTINSELARLFRYRAILGQATRQLTTIELIPPVFIGEVFAEQVERGFLLFGQAVISGGTNLIQNAVEFLAHGFLGLIGI